MSEVIYAVVMFVGVILIVIGIFDYWSDWDTSISDVIDEWWEKPYLKLISGVILLVVGAILLWQHLG